MAKQHRALQRQPSTDKEGRERVHFERVTFSKFSDDIRKYCGDSIRSEDLFDMWNEIPIPKRKTQFSCGYDVATPIPISVPAHSRVIVPTGIKAVFSEDEMKTWCLKLYARSSVGIKDNVVVTNGTGLIDSDFQFSDNDGDMLLALTNMSDVLRQYKPGDRICQAVFEIYGVTSDDDASGTRTGGVGSTGV